MAHVLDQPATKKEFDLKVTFVDSVLETAKLNDADAMVNLFKNSLKSSKSNAYSKFVYATAYDYVSLRSLGVIKGPKLATRELRDRAFLPIGIKKSDKISVVATAIDLFLKNREKDATDLLKLSKIKLDLQTISRNDQRLNVLDHENLVLEQLVNSGVKVAKTLPTEIRNALARARIAAADHANAKTPAELSLDYIVAMETGLGGEIAQYAKKHTALLTGNADFAAAFIALHPAEPGDLAAIKSLIPIFKNTPLGKNKLKALAATANLSPSSAAKVTALIVDYAPKLGPTPSLQLAMIEALNSSQDSKRELAHEIMFEKVSSPEVLASLVKFIAQTQNPSQELQEVTDELVANTEAMQSELIKLLKINNEAIADLVSEIFQENKKLKPAAYSELSELLKIKDPVIELNVLKVISPLLKSDPASHPILLNLLSNGGNPKVKVAVLSNLKYIKLEDPATQLAAIDAVTSLNDPKAAIKLLGKFPKIALPSKNFQQALFKLIQADPATTSAALSILSEAKTLEPSSELLLLDAYTAGDKKAKTIILKILEQLDTISSEAVTRLTAISSNNDKAATQALEVIVTNQFHKKIGDKNLSAKEKCSLLEATFKSLVQ